MANVAPHIVEAVAVKAPDPNIFSWMGVEVVGGGLFILGILGIVKILESLAKKKAIKAQ